MPRLTERFLESAAPAEGQPQTDYMDDNPDFRGFGVRVGAKKKTFFLFFQWHGKRQRLTVGEYPAMSADDARQRVIEARNCLNAVPPVDPRTHFETKAHAGETVADFAAAYLESCKDQTKIADKRRIFENDILPDLGRIPLAQLQRREVAAVIDKVRSRGAIAAADRVQSLCHTLLDEARNKGHVTANVLDKMKRQKSDGESAARSLTLDEIKTIWPALADLPYGDILKLCLLLGRRIGEVCGMRRDEIDFEKAIWTLPGNIAGRSKNGEAWRVPLPPLALAIIRKHCKAAETFVFPSAKGAGHVTTRTLATACETLAEAAAINADRFSSHSFRKTLVTQCRQQLKIDRFIIGCICHHVETIKATVTDEHYDEADYTSDMADALTKWENFVSALVGGNVVPFAKSA